MQPGAVAAACVSESYYTSRRNIGQRYVRMREGTRVIVPGGERRPGPQESGYWLGYSPSQKAGAAFIGSLRSTSPGFSPTLNWVIMSWSS